MCPDGKWVDEYVCGYSYDDYDYGEVNHLLERDLKLYIKAVACFPDATRTTMCPLSWAPIRPSERVRGLHLLPFCHLRSLCRVPLLLPGPSVNLSLFSFSLHQIHVNLLIMEARLQAELLYALRAITQYMIA